MVQYLAQVPGEFTTQSCNMSRLGASDDFLYARYQKGELNGHLNLRLKAASSDQGVKVSKSALIELSALLGDMAERATDSVLLIQELSGEQLKHLAAAMYGKPLGDTCSVADVHALSHFAHKYDVPSLEQAIASIVPDSFAAFQQAEEMLQLYRSVPEDCTLLQDAILSCILRNYKWVDKPEEKLAILPRHLNRWLKHLEHSPSEMLTVIHNIIDKVSGNVGIQPVTKL